jgi:hypothetical protein
MANEIVNANEQQRGRMSSELSTSINRGSLGSSSKRRF